MKFSGRILHILGTYGLMLSISLKLDRLMGSLSALAPSAFILQNAVISCFPNLFEKLHNSIYISHFTILTVSDVKKYVSIVKCEIRVEMCSLSVIAESISIESPPHNNLNL